MGLKEIVKNNHYPIIFIGSGMEKRYLQNFPNWNSLLEEYWEQINENQNFYSFLHSQIQKHPDDDKTTQDFYANVNAASYIQKKFDDLFYKEQLKVSGLTLQQAQQNRVSPFKQSIANRLKRYQLLDNVDMDELNGFIHILEKAKMIVTTNYDTFIQDLIEKDSDQRPTVFVGQSGLFDSDAGWSEIYQIHGSISSPNSIVINSKDYDNFDKNSVLVSAKIMSSMIDAPIIFFGYSMTDRNIRKVLDDFGSQLPQEDPRKSANRILVVDYEPNQNEIVEQIVRDQGLHNLNYTLIKTNNYKKIFNKLSKINEGATPYEVKKFSGLIKKLIVQQGQKGQLSNVMVTPTQLDDVAKEIDQGKPIVVALGDERYFYVYPDTVSYLKDYLADTNNYAPAIALSFAARAGGRTTKLPFAKYWNSVDKTSLNLSQKDFQRINNKIKEYGTLDKAKQFINKGSQKPFNTIKEIKSQHYPIGRQIDTVAWNLEQFDEIEINNYFNEILPTFYKTLVEKSTQLTSSVRRLLVIHDLIINGNMKPYQKTQKNQ
ncbi:SIR2 family protein [Pediococcus inopinatus]|uniref:SIR2 family protein n=1 Tax=Pediococcus inopinatus TaxID=114090 RepID=UPI0007C5948F|nr:SIR2 family protein [Pediococcus inopinatus]